jgi:hypothetical protein
MTGGVDIIVDNQELSMVYNVPIMSFASINPSIDSSITDDIYFIFAEHM